MDGEGSSPFTLDCPGPISLGAAFWGVASRWGSCSDWSFGLGLIFPPNCMGSQVPAEMVGHVLGPNGRSFPQLRGPSDEAAVVSEPRPPVQILLFWSLVAFVVQHLSCL